MFIECSAKKGGEEIVGEGGLFERIVDKVSPPYHAIFELLCFASTQLDDERAIVDSLPTRFGCNRSSTLRSSTRRL